MAKQVFKRHGLVTTVKAEERTDVDGTVEDSKAQLHRATELRILVRHHEIAWFAKQPEFQLGDDHTYRADFIAGNLTGLIHAEEVKGGPDDREFRQTKRLWRKYGRMNLYVLEKKGQRCVIRETIKPVA